MISKGKAPYDEKNALDFSEMSRKIAHALEEIENDPSIPATQKELSKRAKCNRGTLYHRKYPLDRLKEIKVKRKEAGLYKSKKITLEHRTAVEIHIDDKKKLLEQLNNSRNEIAVWVDKFKGVEKEQNKGRRVTELLKAENKALKEQNSELLRRLGERDETIKAESKKEVILPFPGSKRALRKAGEATAPQKV